MGISNGSFLGSLGGLGSVGRGGTSNQTNASFQIGRARRSFGSQQAAYKERQTQPLTVRNMARDFFGFSPRGDVGIQRSLEALRDWEDTPYGPARTYNSAVERTGGNRLLGNAGKGYLPDRATLRRGYQQPTSAAEGALMQMMIKSGQVMSAEQARTGGDRYIQMRFNEPNYRSR
jgi:hypothetical protein